MKLLSRIACAFAMVMACVVAQATTKPNLTPYVKPDSLSNLKLSPTGDYIGGLLRQEGRTMLIVLEPLTGKHVGLLKFTQSTQVLDFWWVNDKRLLVSLGENFGSQDAPSATGELYGVNFDGSEKGMLVGFRVSGPRFGGGVGSRSKSGVVAGELLDPLSSDPDNVLVTIWPLDSKDPVTTVERMNVISGKRIFVTSVPVPRANFLTDNHSRVRFAIGSDVDNASKLYYRADDNAEWKLVNDEKQSGIIEYPVGFSKDDSVAYLQAQQKEGPDKIVAYDVASGKRKDVASDPVVNPAMLDRNGNGDAIGVSFFDARPRTILFDENDPDARIQRMLEVALKGQVVRVVSSTRDGRRKLVYAYSDVDPGTYYMLDATTGKADFYLAARSRIDVGKMAQMQPFDFTARDGMKLHGYITLPRDSKGLVPMVVMPHGGPFGVHDAWGFDNDVQMLAEAGYAVLQVNFRGSDHYGRAYERAGAREWGGKMQDDVTDATQWAIHAGHADPRRICIFGASYGAYAALMGVAKEPDIYRCAVGQMGVYDLRMMTGRGGRKPSAASNWYREWVGDDKAKLEEMSPTRIASRIKVPVLLAAGGEDDTAPISQTRAMTAALRRANVPVETLYYPNEGHGFYTSEHQRAFYEHLLDFLDRYIGSGEKGLN